MNTLNMTRAQWAEVFQAIGMDDAMMRKWHGEFERRYPAQHQSFLEWIGLADDEIVIVRNVSQTS